MPGVSISTNTVEVHDHVAVTWSYMSSRVHHRFMHRLVAIKSKPFVTEKFHFDFEVFDKLTNKFVVIKLPLMIFDTTYVSIVGAISIVNKIAFIGRKTFNNSVI